MILSAVDTLNPCKNISLTLTDPKIRKRFLKIGFVTIMITQEESIGVI